MKEWKTIKTEADLPTEEGNYLARPKYGDAWRPHLDIWEWDALQTMLWMNGVIAYIPEPIPDYEE